MPRPSKTNGNQQLVVAGEQEGRVSTNRKKPRRPNNGGNNQLVPKQQQQQQRRRPPPNDQLVPHKPKPKRPNNELVPHKPKPKRPNNELVHYEPPPEEEYYDDPPPPRKPWGAQFCEPRCFLLLLLLLFFGLMLLICAILLILSIEKEDPPNLAGFLFPVYPRTPDGYLDPQFGDKFGSALSVSGPFLAISAPERENDNGSIGAVFLYVWVGNFYAIYGDDGVLTPPDPDYEPETWLPFLQDQQAKDREEKDANRIHFDNTNPESIKWSKDGKRVFIGIPNQSSVIVYNFTHPLRESDYMASVTVEPPYQEGGEIIQVSSDGNRVALTAKYNETLLSLMEEEEKDGNRRRRNIRRQLDDENEDDLTALPRLVQVYDYLESNKTWVPYGNPINATMEEDFDGEFGTAMTMSLDGTTIAVSNPTALNGTGWIKVYREENGVWDQVGDKIVGQFVGQNFGYSLDLNEDGRILAGGGPFLGNGAVYTYELTFFNSGSGNTAQWTEFGKQQRLLGNTTDEMFGYSLSLSESGKSLLVGAPGAHDGIGKMVLYEYFKPQDTWFAYVELPQKDQYGNYAASGGYGVSVELANGGDTVVIGAANHTTQEEGDDYVEYFDKAPKGIDLEGWTTPPHVCVEHSNDPEFNCD